MAPWGEIRWAKGQGGGARETKGEEGVGGGDGEDGRATGGREGGRGEEGGCKGSNLAVMTREKNLILTLNILLQRCNLVSDSSHNQAHTEETSPPPICSWLEQCPNERLVPTEEERRRDLKDLRDLFSDWNMQKKISKPENQESE